MCSLTRWLTWINMTNSLTSIATMRWWFLQKKQFSRIRFWTIKQLTPKNLTGFIVLLTESTTYCRQSCSLRLPTFKLLAHRAWQTLRLASLWHLECSGTPKSSINLCTNRPIKYGSQKRSSILILRHSQLLASEESVQHAQKLSKMGLALEW